MVKLAMIVTQKWVSGPVLLCMLLWAMSSDATWAQAHDPVALKITAPRTTLREGETLQLTVQARFSDRSIRDVTANSLTQYGTGDRRLAVINKTGLVRALSTQRQAQGPVDVVAFYGALGVGVRLNLLKTEKPVPAPRKAEEPIALEITAPKTTLRQGETVQLRVVVTFPDGSTEDVTSTSRGTNYQRDFRKVTLDDNGLVTAFSTDAGEVESERIWLTYRSFAGMVNLTILRDGPSLQGGALEVTTSKTTLRTGESVQLTVQQKLPDGSTQDLTDPSTGTTYLTTDASTLIPEPDGGVTCIGTRRRAQKYTVIVARNGNLQGWIKFRHLPAGLGPGLEVVADRTVLHEGEQTQLGVYKPLPGGGRQPVSATSTGTRYLTFVTSGTYDPSLVRVRITDKGLVSAPVSIGSLPRFTLIVFVRHGDAVGWVKLNVLRKDG